MNTFLWIITVILAVLTFVPGMVKVVQPREKLLEKMAWANDFSQNQIRAIGGLEVVAAVALIVPGIVGFVPVLIVSRPCVTCWSYFANHPGHLSPKPRAFALDSSSFSS